MRIFRVSRLLGLVLPLCSLPIFAQAPEARLGKGITDSARVVLSQSRTLRVRDAQDLGPVSPEMAMPGITLVFRRSPAQETALEALLAAQQDRNSRLYHRWLTPEAFAARFGVANSDIATAEDWLVSHGFHIDSVARSRDRITFSGSAAQVQSAFGAELHHYRAEGELHFAPASDLSLPTELAAVTSSVLHISDFRPKSSVKAMAGARPDFTSSATQAHYLVPNDVRTMYDFTINYDGSGQGLAVVGQSFVDRNVIGTFQGLLTGYTPISPVLVPGSGVEAMAPGDESESELDLEYAAGIAQNANIFFVYVGANQNYSVMDALSFAITQRIASVVSISYGVCETLMSPGDLDQYNALFEEASAQGQTLVAASGDSGSTACAQYSAAQGLTPAQQQALSVNFPASSPNVTAVGGTQMAPGTFAAGDSPYWWSATSIDNSQSLRSYVPEVVWNEGSAAHGMAAGGGGTSAHFSRPKWQGEFPGMPAGNYRLLPDVALQSSITSPGFLLCTSDPAMLHAEGQTAGCVFALTGSNNKFTLAGGTSFAAPIFAGLVAILNEYEGAIGQGNINPELYSLATSSKNIFHDITTGTNACVAGSANCGNAGESAYGATAGYDEATGLGSIDENALVTAWPSSIAAGVQPTGIFFIGSATSTMPGQTVSVEIDVYSASLPSSATAPTGGVSVSVDGTVVNSSLAFTKTYQSNPQQVAAQYDFLAPTGSGSHLISVTYPGDATHAPSSAVYVVTVGNVMASGGMTLSAGNLTIASGSTGSTKVTVTPSGGYSGRIVWALSATGTTPLTACYDIGALPAIQSVSTTNLTIGIGTACNSALPASRATFRAVSHRTLPNDQNPGYRSSTAVTGIDACVLICGCFAGWWRKSKLSLLLVVILFLPLAGATLAGCGGGGSHSPNPPVTSNATTYTLTLTATDSVNTGIIASTTFTLTVN